MPVHLMNGNLPDVCFSTAYRERRKCLFVTVWYLTLLIHWSIVAIWLIFRYSTATTTDFAREIRELIPENSVPLCNTRLSCSAHPFMID